jgi:hypothetical protein
MKIKIPSPKHYETHYGASQFVRSYLDRVEEQMGEALHSEALDTLRISLLIAHPQELEEGKFLAFESFDWRCGYGTVGVNGDFGRYHLGDDREKVREISQMLRSAFAQVGRKRKAKFDEKLAGEILDRVTEEFLAETGNPDRGETAIFQNGFLVQGLYEIPRVMEDMINACGYLGLSARHSDPLMTLPDRESRELSREATWREVSPGMYQMLEFISDPDILLRYLKACREREIPVRLLFAQSDYSQEVWTGPDIPKRCIGFEYSPVPIDNQIIGDLYCCEFLVPFRKRLNSYGLFFTQEEAAAFKNAYDRAFAAGKIGDGDMETHIFCLYEVDPEDVMRCLERKTETEKGGESHG